MTKFFLLGTVFAIIFFKSKRLTISLILILILYYGLITCVGLMQSDQRYRLPIIPVDIIFSGLFADLIMVYFMRASKFVAKFLS